MSQLEFERQVEFFLRLLEERGWDLIPPVGWKDDPEFPWADRHWEDFFGPLAERTTSTELRDLVRKAVVREIDRDRQGVFEKLGLYSAVEAMDVDFRSMRHDVEVLFCDEPSIGPEWLHTGDGEDHHYESPVTLRVSLTSDEPRGPRSVARIVEGMVWGTLDHNGKVATLDASNLLVTD